MPFVYAILNKINSHRIRLSNKARTTSCIDIPLIHTPRYRNIISAPANKASANPPIFFIFRHFAFVYAIVYFQNTLVHGNKAAHNKSFFGLIPRNHMSPIYRILYGGQGTILRYTINKSSRRPCGISQHIAIVRATINGYLTINHSNKATIVASTHATVVYRVLNCR